MFLSCAFLSKGTFTSYRVELRAQANFSAPTFEPAHVARTGKRAALSVPLRPAGSDPRVGDGLP